MAEGSFNLVLQKLPLYYNSRKLIYYLYIGVSAVLSKAACV